jgi:8-oxo-dGTP pyrophosphatase MutT (NUDIX family)
MNPHSPHLAAHTIPIHPTIDLSILGASRKVFIDKKRSASGQSYSKVVIGAAIFRHEADGNHANTPRLLLLKRADHESYFPGVFEIPGGKVDANDPSIKHAITREVLEETGLAVTEFLAEVTPMLYTTEKQVGGEVIRKRAIQLNYVVACSEGEIKLSSDEHSESVWAAEGELDNLNITDDMRKVVREAFRRSSMVASRHDIVYGI